MMGSGSREELEYRESDIATGANGDHGSSWGRSGQGGSGRFGQQREEFNWFS
jgi:hypothetical protein